MNCNQKTKSYPYKCLLNEISPTNSIMGSIGHQLEDVDVDDLMRRYTNDVIASAGFGLQVNSLVDKDNEFYECGQAMFSTSWPQRFKMILAAQFPTLAKVCNFT